MAGAGDGVVLVAAFHAKLVSPSPSSKAASVVVCWVGLGRGEKRICSLQRPVRHARFARRMHERTHLHSFFPLVSSHPFDNFFATPSLLGDS